MMKKLLLLNGPNLNLLGTREPELYGQQGLDQIVVDLQSQAKKAACELDALQSNREYELIERNHAAATDGTAFILINPAAFTHTSIALRDALLGVSIPFIELHLSNVFAREEFRHHSFLSDIAKGVITGFGPMSYTLALQAAIHYLETESK